MRRKPPQGRPSALETERPNSWPIYGLVGTVAIACYFNGINGDFVHDDIPAVTLNKDVIGINPISYVLGNDFWGTSMGDPASHKSYRPLTTLTFRLNYTLFGLQPVWFHMTNVMLHAAACVLFTKVCECIAGLRPPFATMAGLLFAVHPVHTEAVTGIVGRADVLACVFLLFSLLTYHGCREGQGRIWLSILFGALSMLAKETGIMVFVLNLSYDFYLHWSSIKRSVSELKWNSEALQFSNRAAKILTSLGVLLTIRLAILQGSLPKFSQQDNPAAFDSSFYVRFLTFCYLAAFNWWLVLCPETLSHDWQMGSIPLVTSLSDSRNVVTCFFFSVALLLVVKSFADFQNQKHVPIVLGFAMLLFPFLPATNLLVTVGFVVAERVLYIPSLGSVLLVVYGIQLLWMNYSQHRQTIVCLVLMMLVTGSLRTSLRNRDWRSRESLLRAGLMMLPHNAKMHYNYANFLRDSARPELAKTHYQMALKLWPGYASAHNNLGTLLSNEFDAEQHFLAAITYSADHLNAHYNLGQLYRRNNKSFESETMLKRCIAIAPAFAPAYLELAKLRGPNDLMARELLKQVVELNPTEPYHITSVGHWLMENGKYREALFYYRKTLRISPSYQEALIGVGKLLRKFGQKSRVFKLITRWQLIRRLKQGQPSPSPHIYLQDWLLRTELSGIARSYDMVQKHNTISRVCRGSLSSKVIECSSRKEVVGYLRNNKSANNYVPSSEMPSSKKMVHHISGDV